MPCSGFRPVGFGAVRARRSTWSAMHRLERASGDLHLHTACAELALHGHRVALIDRDQSQHRIMARLLDVDVAHGRMAVPRLLA